jgi:hypothetical protein
LCDSEQTMVGIADILSVIGTATGWLESGIVTSQAIENTAVAPP